MGLIFSGLIIVFNEPLAMLSIRLYHKLFGIQTSESLVKNTKMSFIIYGTVLMVLTAVELKAIWLAMPAGG